MDYDFVDYFNKHYHTVQKTKKSIKKNPYVRIIKRHSLTITVFSQIVSSETVLFELLKPWKSHIFSH